MFIPKSRLRVTNQSNIKDISLQAMTLVSEVEQKLGVIKRRNVLIRHQTLSDDGLILDIKDDLITPIPRVQLITPKLEDLVKPDGIKLKQEDFLVRGIPITLTLDFLYENVEFYIIDPVFNEDKTKIVWGIFCKPLMRLEKKIASRQLILRQMDDQPLPIDYHPA